MAPSLPRSNFKSGLNSSRLVRLLADLASPAAENSGQAASAKQSFAEKLGLWLDWPDAIALAAALNRDRAVNLANSAGAQAADRPTASAVFEDYARVRTELASAMMADDSFVAAAVVTKPLLQSASAVAMTTACHHAPDHSAYRRAYRHHQRTMAVAIAALRNRVRDQLSSVSPALGQLAALDASLDKALGAREHQLLGKVPALLEKHFERLRLADQAAFDQTEAPQLQAHSAHAASVLAEYGRVMQGVLLAELELRLQPIEGMLETMGYDTDEVTGRYE